MMLSLIASVNAGFFDSGFDWDDFGDDFFSDDFDSGWGTDDVEVVHVYDEIELGGGFGHDEDEDFWDEDFGFGDDDGLNCGHGDHWGCRVNQQRLFSVWWIGHSRDDTAGLALRFNRRLTMPLGLLHHLHQYFPRLLCAPHLAAESDAGAFDAVSRF